jgi:hypothetical protein
MRHDPVLMKLLLLNVRDGGHEEEIRGFPEPLVLDQCAYLIDCGYVDGKYVKGQQGQLVSAAMTRLLPRGHDYLNEIESNQIATPTPVSKQPAIRIFMSHSSADRELAAALIDLLRDALALPPEHIRCTSVDGYRLPSGANTNEQLRAEIHESETFIALLTAASITSTYVLFELGARWGVGRHWALLTARGLSGGDLREPLKTHNALDASSEAQIDQFLAELADRLGIKLTIRSAWGAKVRRVAELANAPPAVAPSAAK